MAIIECSQCKNKKYIAVFKNQYTYKLRDKKGKMHYFCDYVCMRKARAENPDNWAKNRG